MIAQAYYNEKPIIIRIFKGYNSQYIAELPLDEPNDKKADISLRMIKMRRIEKWKDTSWGKEARVRFVTV